MKILVVIQRLLNKHLSVLETGGRCRIDQSICQKSKQQALLFLLRSTTTKNHGGIGLIAFLLEGTFSLQEITGG